MKPLIHFAHANGVPSLVYQKLFDLLQDDYDIIYVPLIGPDKRYPIDNHWRSLTQQIIDSIVQQANGRKVIGLGHSLGSVLTFQAALRCPELFERVIMLDPPLIMGKEGFALHFAKMLNLKILDKMSPAGLSKRRRDHWESREQAATLLRPKAFYKDFDDACFQAYLDHALKEDRIRGGVELTISREDEVKIFRTNPSLWWLPQQKPQIPVDMLVAEHGPFLVRKFPQKAEKKFGIHFDVIAGGHMFPLECPALVAQFIKQKTS
ncbi:MULTISPECIES: alpha/beta hydrolase [unclassified Acinetobacter]|uniref:alpha/beta hydrolase n=1 Tax=unclassified Acinetobacter TaxID=196816 RepID=UPI002934E841|nr:MULTISPECIES: alpha/beta hydrolase [unclassified Acinetobacter]WOE31568.1 alpha/beta hydrolase [Acinetobacter sp. SAAs470]WOE39765.1 alpha/beta hydrolase [Acinetobacter sp. SAAs474]